jgi:hypothetical protein
MGERVSDLGKKGLALGVLLLAAFVVFKVVLGIVSTIVWIAVVAVAIVAVIWAIRVL